MELIKLYDIAEKENIDVIDFKMENKAIIGNINEGYRFAYEFAEELGVTEELIKKAYSYYFA